MSLPPDELREFLHRPSKLRTLDDEDLVAAVRMGCGDALAVLFERHSSLVFRIARSILRDDGEAEETVQRVFLDVYQTIEQFNPERAPFKTWLLQYAYHRTINRREHLLANRVYNQENVETLVPKQLFHGAGRLLSLSPQEIKCLVKQVLGSIQPRQRKIIELTYFEGMTADEVAKETGETVFAVRNNLYKTLARLRSVLLDRERVKKTVVGESEVAAEGMLFEQSRTI